MTLPTFGRQYLHVMVYWLLHGKHLKKYGGNWEKFRASGKHVDHGLEGRPHELDYRVLRLLPSSGRLSNPAQGARLRWQYKAEGGLGKLVARTHAKKKVLCR